MIVLFRYEVDKTEMKKPQCGVWSKNHLKYVQKIAMIRLSKKHDDSVISR